MTKLDPQAARLTGLVSRIRIEEDYWPGLTEVFYRSANEGILPRTIKSLRFIRRLALCRNDNISKETNLQWQN
jgi:hypothetical protein